MGNSSIPATAGGRAASIPRCARILPGVVIGASVPATTTVDILRISISRNIPAAAIEHIVFSVTTSAPTCATSACIIAASVISVSTAPVTRPGTAAPRPEVPTANPATPAETTRATAPAAAAAPTPRDLHSQFCTHYLHAVHVAARQLGLVHVEELDEREARRIKRHPHLVQLAVLLELHLQILLLDALVQPAHVHARVSLRRHLAAKNTG